METDVYFSDKTFSRRKKKKKDIYNQLSYLFQQLVEPKNSVGIPRPNLMKLQNDKLQQKTFML